MALLEVNDLNVSFLSDGKLLPAVSDISFTVEEGEILALVGESGCGKSITCMSLAKLLPGAARILSGEVKLKTGSGGTTDVMKLEGRELRKIRGGKIAYIFQEPSVSLNPVFRVGEQIAEVLELHRPDVSDPWKEAEELLKKVGIPDPASRVRLYPHEMSGGMQQRVMIAMAVASHPALLIADEPTTALDVTIQAQILDLLLELRRTLGTSMILVTHNLGIVSETADRV
ncbi:MAG: ABC transporter ATP-binding protein, partial [Lentisphaeria bacterium]|nr:ABC transporter ATP-binding protein [Lentisphaeria bacterium]